MDKRPACRCKVCVAGNQHCVFAALGIQSIKKEFDRDVHVGLLLLARRSLRLQVPPQDDPKSGRRLNSRKPVCLTVGLVWTTMMRVFLSDFGREIFDRAI